MANKVGEGVSESYKKYAKKGGDVLWLVKIKGQSELTEGVLLHMSLKVFEDRKEMNLDEIKEKVKQFKIKTPDPKELSFKTTIFTSERDGAKYYMLTIEGTDKSYEDFYNSLKHCGTVYKKFMPHITIDKGLYDRINEEGLKSEEVEFENLSIEYGAGNTVHEFKKSLDIEIMQETIWLNLELNEKHFIGSLLKAEVFNNYLEDHPELENQIMQKHEERIKFHFGENKELIDFAWKNGIDKTYVFMRNKK